MKKLFLIVTAMFAVVSFSSCDKDDDNGSDLARPALPDPDDVCSCMDDLYFMDYCYTNFDVNKDGKVSKVEAEAVGTMPISYQSRNVTSLKGIGYFANLRELDCGYTSLTEVDLSQNKKLTKINFSHCSDLEHITLPDAPILIRYEIFDDCTNLTSVTIPNGVTSVESGIFCGCSNLQSFKGKFASSDNRCLIMDDGTLVAFAPAGLTEYTIPKSVTSIGNSVFSSCNNLTNITIPNSVTSIGDWAFCRCSSLRRIITIPNSVTLIGNYAFYRCSSLRSIIIPTSVTSIGDRAFEYCDSLEEIYCMPSTPPSLGGDYEEFPYHVFPFYANINVPTKSVNAYKTAEDWKEYADQIVGSDFSIFLIE